MTNGLFKKWLSAALCLAALGSSAAWAEADTFYLGNGHSGALSVSATITVINTYAQVTAPLAPKDLTLSVGASAGASAGFAAGDLVLVLQTTGLVPVPASGGTSAVDVSTDPVGRFELARLASVSGSTLTLTAGLLHSYAANVTQVIRVPEYTTVTVSGTGRISATPWNGSVGGVIAFLATGEVSNAGQINANATGFRGGAYVSSGAFTTGCTALDDTPPNSGQKGEGIVNVRYGATFGGRGNVANGAGGGDCLQSGGGGGGNAGAGGKGGRTDGTKADTARDVGGLGGTALTYSMVDHLTFGGGGGAGQGVANTGGAGGQGGGIIFVRANVLSGSGSLSATGGQGFSSADEAGSGGGAGGSISLRLAGTASCGSVTASGGIGGSANSSQVGPGGGGGGGRVLFQSAGSTCPTTFDGANPGVQTNPAAPDGVSYGAKVGAVGSLTPISGAYSPPAAPVVATPADGSSIRDNRPSFTGTGTPGTTVYVVIDGVEQSTPVTVDASGHWSFELPTGATLNEGSHTVWAYAESSGVRSARSNTNTFTEDRTAPAAPVIVAPTQGATVDSSTPPITGTGEPGSTVTVTLDGKQVGTVPVDASGNWSYTPTTPLNAGPHQVVAVDTDAAGNTSPPSATRDFTVGTDTTIISGPSGRVTDRNATFEFGPDVPGVTYECRLDGGPWVACTSPTSYSDLADGEHTFQVRSKDSVGNVDPTPATRTWTVAPLVAFRGNGLGCSATGAESSLGMLLAALMLRNRRRTRR